jgi:hypothetical protein
MNKTELNISDTYVYILTYYENNNSFKNCITLFIGQRQVTIYTACFDFK